MGEEQQVIHFSERPQVPDPPATRVRLSSLLRLIRRAWPIGRPKPDIAALPYSVADLFVRKREGGPFAAVAAELDRGLPGWTDIAADAIATAAGDQIGPELRRVCAILARRPVGRPDNLTSALMRVPPDADAAFWLLVSLAGTDTAAVRKQWLSKLRSHLESRPGRPSRVLWFGFVRAFVEGWLDWPLFRDCVAHGHVLAAARPSGDYRPSLRRLGLSTHPGFNKRYRQAVYEIAGEPDAPLSMAVGGWIRDFPGQAYLWDAVAQLEQNATAWWPLHMVRWISGIEPEDGRVAARLARASPVVLAQLSLLRSDLCKAVAVALGQPDHYSAIEWLKGSPQSHALDPGWMIQQLGPWAQQVGGVVVLAAEAISSVDPPPDYIGPEDESRRRRAFIRRCVLPGLDRVLDNLWYVHALRREHLARTLQYAGRGRPAAVRALAFWPDRVEETAPVLLQAVRRGTRSARIAAREALDILGAGARTAHIHHLERRIDLASAWADGDLDGRPGRVWRNVAGYSIKLSLAAGGVSLQVFTQTRRLAGVPMAVRAHPLYAEVRAARLQLSKRYRYFRRRLEEAMVEGVRYSADEFATLIGSPVVRSLVSRLLISCDGRHLLWTAADAFDESGPPAEIGGAELIWIVHPADLGSDGQLGEWQERIIRARVAQPFKQLFREVYALADRERASSGCSRFSGQPVVARRAFALLRSRGYAPGRGDAVKEWPVLGLRAHIQWSRSAERTGRLIAERDAAEAVITGDVWFEDTAGEAIPLESVPLVMMSETLRDADLLASRAFAGELGLTSEGIRSVRAVLVRHLARDLGLTTIYVSEDENHAIVEGQRSLYRVHLGSGTVLLEGSRRNLDMRGVGNRRIEDLVSESMDSGTARILGIIGALSEDQEITNPAFLRQLAGGPR